MCTFFIQITYYMVAICGGYNEVPIISLCIEFWPPLRDTPGEESGCVRKYAITCQYWYMTNAPVFTNTGIILE